MAKTIAIGLQDFGKIKTKNTFYIDKTDFIQEWWEAADDVTLITRPRRFGKTLTMSMVDLYNEYDFLTEGDLLNAKEKEYFHRISAEMEDYEISISLKRLSNYLYQYYNQKVIILLDEYDTPVQEAFVGGYWEELVSFIISLELIMYDVPPCVVYCNQSINEKS